MNSKYTGSKVRNQFTAYLLSQIRGRRRKYLEKKIQIYDAEELKKGFPTIKGMYTVDEAVELKEKERLLLYEAQGKYPDWNEMTDLKLVQALMSLREDERQLIYQRIFEEMSYTDMSKKNGIPIEKIKGVYGYAIKKIRKKMKGDL